MTRVFRTTTKHWITQVAPLCLITLGLLTFGFSLARGDDPSEGITLSLLGLAALYSLASNHLLPGVRDFIQLDQSGIHAHMNSVVTVRWQDIISICLENQTFGPVIEVLTNESNLYIPIQKFDEKQIWKLTQKLEPAHALEPEAYRRTEAYQQFDRGAEQLLKDVILPIQCSFIPHPFLGIFTIALFVALALWCWWNQQAGIALLWIVICCFSFYALLVKGVIEIDERGIHVCTVWSHNFIAWHEINSIGSDTTGTIFWLTGDNKQLVMPGPSRWSGPQQKVGVDYFEAQLNHRHLEIQAHPESLWPRSKNTHQA